jgi:hypothetical protein
VCRVGSPCHRDQLVVAQLSFYDRQDDVACLADGGSDVLDDDNGPAHELAVQLAHGRLV